MFYDPVRTVRHTHTRTRNMKRYLDGNVTGDDSGARADDIDVIEVTDVASSQQHESSSPSPSPTPEKRPCKFIFCNEFEDIHNRLQETYGRSYVSMREQVYDAMSDMDTWKPVDDVRGGAFAITIPVPSDWNMGYLTHLIHELQEGWFDVFGAAHEKDHFMTWIKYAKKTPGSPDPMFSVVVPREFHFKLPSRIQIRSHADGDSEWDDMATLYNTGVHPPPRTPDK